MGFFILMRFVNYLDPSHHSKVALHAGPLGDGTLLDLEYLNIKTTLDLISNFQVYESALKTLQKNDLEKRLPTQSYFSEKNVELLSPLKPLSIRDAYTFRQHVETSRRNRGLPMIPEFDLFPVFYFTNHLAIKGSGPVEIPKKAQEKLDFELEVAIVIGKEGKNIKAEKADDYIFGYTILNDWSDRAIWILQESKLNLGPAKAKDFATSLGPYLVTRDELKEKRIPTQNGERFDLKMKAFVNGKQYSEGNLKDMQWTFAQVIERVSDGVTLYPGEVIASGTVGTGCFFELNGSKITDNLWLKVGDQVVLEVEKLGRLENTIANATL